MSPADLRERIAAALRARHGGDAALAKYPTEHDRALWVATWRDGDATQRAHTATPDLDALRALALAVGLDADGTDPRAEMERLRRTLALSQASLAVAVRGDRVTVVDEIERLTRERDAALADAARLRAAAGEYLAANDALRVARYVRDHGTPRNVGEWGTQMDAVTKAAARFDDALGAIVALVDGAP